VPFVASCSITALAAAAAPTAAATVSSSNIASSRVGGSGAGPKGITTMYYFCQYYYAQTTHFKFRVIQSKVYEHMHVSFPTRGMTILRDFLYFDVV
jgi:malic enzyme